MNKSQDKKEPQYKIVKSNNKSSHRKDKRVPINYE